jgi:hydrogenase maturation protein HypF
MISSGLRSPLSSSCGRLFDAVAALAGLAPLENEFEAEAAMRLEAAAGPGRDAYPFDLHGGPGSPLRLSFLPAIRSIVADVRRGRAPEEISAGFHNTLARAAVDVARQAKKTAGAEVVVLTGGVFLNRKLLGRTEAALQRAGFAVLRPVEYSPNDESISVGQVAYALARLKKHRARR